jgi:hypothetical protein
LDLLAKKMKFSIHDDLFNGMNRPIARGNNVKRFELYGNLQELFIGIQLSALK